MPTTGGQWSLEEDFYERQMFSGPDGVKTLFICSARRTKKETPPFRGRTKGGWLFETVTQIFTDSLLRLGFLLLFFVFSSFHFSELNSKEMQVREGVVK